MSYTTLTNLQINKRVAEIWLCHNEWRVLDDKIIIMREYIVGSPYGPYTSYEPCAEFDPCTDIACLSMICVAHGIVMNPDGSADMGLHNIHTKCETPYRSALICYLTYIDEVL